MRTIGITLTLFSALLSVAPFCIPQTGASDASLGHRHGSRVLELDSADVVWIHPDAVPLADVGCEAGWTTIFSEDFEGSFPGPWVIADTNPGYGEYYWAKRNCRAYSGAYGGWAVGGGKDGSALPCGAYYPSGASSWLVYGPFTLADATAAELTFRLWMNSEEEYDWLWCMVAIDGLHFSGSGAHGSFGGWELARLDLSDVYLLGDVTSEPQVWIGLIFETDSTVNRPEGAYVDDILLRKYVSIPTITPTLTSLPEPPELLEPADGAVLPQPLPPGEWVFRWYGRAGSCSGSMSAQGPGGRYVSGSSHTGPTYEYRYTSGAYLPDDALGPWYWQAYISCPAGSCESETRMFRVEPAPRSVFLPVVLKHPYSCREPANDTREGACGPMRSQVNYEEYIESPADEDWFYFEKSRTAAVKAELEVPSTADYELYLMDAAGKRIDYSATAEQVEVIDVDGLAAGRYYLLVFRADDGGWSDSQAYRLRVRYE